MKEMVYRNSREVWIGKIRFSDTLAYGYYKGFQYWIISLGTHPCAYVEIPKGHKYFGKPYDEIPLDCHGGVTYSESDLVFHEYSPKYHCEVKTTIEDTWIIGWDYAHSGDYYASYVGGSWMGDKKWRTEDIFNEIKYVVNQLNGECIL